MQSWGSVALRCDRFITSRTLLGDLYKSTVFDPVSNRNSPSGGAREKLLHMVYTEICVSTYEGC